MLLVLKSCRALLKTAGKIAMHGMAHEARIIDSLESCVLTFFCKLSYSNLFLLFRDLSYFLKSAVSVNAITTKPNFSS
jgi:hypothetical protein